MAFSVSDDQGPESHPLTQIFGLLSQIDGLASVRSISIEFTGTIQCLKPCLELRPRPLELHQHNPVIRAA